MEIMGREIDNRVVAVGGAGLLGAVVWLAQRGSASGEAPNAYIQPAEGYSWGDILGGMDGGGLQGSPGEPGPPGAPGPPGPPGGSPGGNDGRCRSDAECGPTQACRRGRCVAASSCRRDRDCPAGEVCESGTCVAGTIPPGDPGDPDGVCPVGSSGPCSSEADCERGERCHTDGCCGPPNASGPVGGQVCSTDNDCLQGWNCCESPCRDGAFCSPKPCDKTHFACPGGGGGKGRKPGGKDKDKDKDKGRNRDECRNDHDCGGRKICRHKRCVEPSGTGRDRPQQPSRGRPTAFDQRPDPGVNRDRDRDRDGGRNNGGSGSANANAGNVTHGNIGPNANVTINANAGNAYENQSGGNGNASGRGNGSQRRGDIGDRCSRNNDCRDGLRCRDRRCELPARGGEAVSGGTETYENGFGRMDGMAGVNTGYVRTNPTPGGTVGGFSAAPAANRPAGSTAVIRQGETLRQLTRRVYGDDLFLPQLYRLNKDVLIGGKAIPAGTVLRIG